MARKEKEQQESEVEIDANHAELRVYEVSFHVDPELTQDEAKKVYEGLKAAVTSKGSLVAEGELEKISLAYTISRMSPSGRRDFDSSYFGWLAFESDGQGHEAVIEAVSEENRIFRFLDVRTSKDAAKHAAEMHEFYRKAPEASGEEDANDPVDVELDAALKEAGVA